MSIMRYKTDPVYLSIVGAHFLLLANPAADGLFYITSGGKSKKSAF